MSLNWRNKIGYRKGHGVHSPFVYNLITKVIEERCLYYRFQDIELLRKQLLHKEEVIAKQTIAAIVKREAIKPKHGALLFRLTNYFRPEKILQIGSSMGLSTLYLSSYKPGLTCISLEDTPEYASISQWVYEKGARTSIDLRIGDYKQLLPGILEEMDTLDFVFFKLRKKQEEELRIFQECLHYITDQTVFVFEGIRTSRRMRDCWKQVCAHEKTTVCLDLFSMGIVFFNPKLHKRVYNVYF